MSQSGIDHSSGGLNRARQHMPAGSHLQHAHVMLVAASIAAAGIVVVAATVVTTLL
tara:strand:+ start:12036 stop:12203 length:168 start_codon:yes stop_codon:yes gene_type:complete